MAKGMTKPQVAEHLAEKTGLTKKQVVQVLEEMAMLAYSEAQNGFSVPGLGKLVVVDRPARMGRNPKTGEPLQIPAKRALKFRISKEAKDAVVKQAQPAAEPSM